MRKIKLFLGIAGGRVRRKHSNPLLLSRGGFTFVEMLMVVVLVGILVGIAVPGYLKAVEKGRSVEAIKMLGLITDMEHAYYVENDCYIDLDQLTIWGRGPNWALMGMKDPNLEPGYLFYYNINPWAGGNDADPRSWTINAWPRKLGTNDPQMGDDSKVIYIWLENGTLAGGWPH